MDARCRSRTCYRPNINWFIWIRIIGFMPTEELPKSPTHCRVNHNAVQSPPAQSGKNKHVLPSRSESVSVQRFSGRIESWSIRTSNSPLLPCVPTTSDQSYRLFSAINSLEIFQTLSVAHY